MSDNTNNTNDLDLNVLLNMVEEFSENDMVWAECLWAVLTGEATQDAIGYLITAPVNGEEGQDDAVDDPPAAVSRGRRPAPAPEPEPEVRRGRRPAPAPEPDPEPEVRRGPGRPPRNPAPEPEVRRGPGRPPRGPARESEDIDTPPVRSARPAAPARMLRR